MSKEIVSIVYVELDALLDTRLPTLGKISSQAAIDASIHPEYYSRICDDFTEICGVTQEAFRNVYAKRDTEILEASVMTEIPFILNELILKLERDTIDTPFADRVELEVNIWPYRLEVETCNALELAVMTRAGFQTRVVCVNRPYAQMTPEMIKGRYSGLIMYNFREWLSHHVEAFNRVKMPKVTILAPALYHDSAMITPDDAYVADGMKPEINTFQLTEIGMLEMFSLSLLPAINFSMVRFPADHDVSDPTARPSTVTVPVFDDLQPAGQ